MTQITTFLSPSGQQQTHADGPATRILVGTVTGVATLERETPTAAWAVTGHSLPDRHVGQLAYDTGSGKLFAGAHKQDGGLWVSDDGAGASWRRIGEDLEKQHFYALAVRRNGDKATVFAGTSPAALYRSDDLGESWSEVTSIYDVADTDKWTFPPPPHIPHIKQIVFHPSEPETLYVLVEQGAFLKSTDDGRTFTDLTSYSHKDDASYRDLHRLLIKQDEPNVFYVVTGVGIYRSEDGGDSYSQLSRRGERMGYPDFVFLDPNDDRTVYSGGSELNPRVWYETGSAKSCVMRSTDEGKNWLELDNGLPSPMDGALEAMTQHVWDGGMMLLGGTATGEIYASEDGGASWGCIAEGLGPVAKDDHHLPFLSEEVRAKELAIRRADEAAQQAS